MSRSLGDIDCGPHVLPIPHIRQLAIPRSGARLVMASDGLWDHLSGSQACKEIRTEMLSQAPKQLLNVAKHAAGRLSDDTTILIVDMLPKGINDYTKNRKSLRKKAAAIFQALVRKLKANQSLACFNRGISRDLELYADVDGNLEYPEALCSRMETDLLGDASAWDTMHSHQLSRTSSDGWDLRSSGWDYSHDGEDVWGNSREDNEELGYAECELPPHIMDSARNYADHSRNDLKHQQGAQGGLVSCVIHVSLCTECIYNVTDETAEEDFVDPPTC